jgi:hypothetical protein
MIRKKVTRFAVDVKKIRNAFSAQGEICPRHGNCCPLSTSRVVRARLKKWRLTALANGHSGDKRRQEKLSNSHHDVVCPLFSNIALIVRCTSRLYERKLTTTIRAADREGKQPIHAVGEIVEWQAWRNEVALNDIRNHNLRSHHAIHGWVYYPQRRYPGNSKNMLMKVTFGPRWFVGKYRTQDLGT